MNSISLRLIVGGLAAGLIALSSAGSTFAASPTSASPKVRHTQAQDNQALALFPTPNDSFGTPAVPGDVRSRIEVPTAQGLRWIELDERPRKD
jgi:hypothetical protein